MTSSSAATVTSPTSRSVFACSLLVKIDNVTEPWRPLVEFLVASGARWGEVTALRPSDVDRVAGTVRITRAWKPIAGGYESAHRRPRSRCAPSNIPKSVLDKLDYSGEFLFVNQAGQPGAQQWIPQSRLAPRCGPYGPEPEATGA